MRIEALTFYRFVAAALVVFNHLDKSIVNFDFANQMVTFFFVLSGFVMTVAYYSKEEFSTQSYVIHRISRIVPVYLVALALIMYVRPVSVSAAIMNLTFLQAWFPPYPLSANYPAWSLSVEMFFYVSFPLILANMKKVPAGQFMLVAVICWGFTQAVSMNLLNSPFYTGFPSRSHDLIFYFPLGHLCSFLLGMGAASMFLHNKPQWRISAVPSFLAIAAILMLVAFDYQLEVLISSMVGYEFRLGGSFYAPLFTALILLTALSDNFFTRALSLKVPVLLGEASYAMYILQVPIIMLINNWIVPLTSFDKMERIALHLSLLTAISILTFYWIEKPGKRLVRRLYNRT
jgi:peptidoglycan/LPS O-acetylase OafA/YrhL